MLDIADLDAVNTWFDVQGPYDIVFNCAALTDPSQCESNYDLAFTTNALGASYIALACAKCGATLVQMSTGQVFPGSKTLYSEDDFPTPETDYGKTRLLGEGLAFAANPRTHVIRTSWVYGPNDRLLDPLLDYARSHATVQAPDDVLGNPLSVMNVAHTMLSIALSSEYGRWHVASKDGCSLADFAGVALQEFGIACNVQRRSHESLEAIHPSIANVLPCPLLESERFATMLGDELPAWKDSLRAYHSHHANHAYL